MPRGYTAFRRREPLSRHTTLRIGGPASFWYEPVDGELAAVSDMATHAGLPVLVIGSGSNCLVSDDGFDGLVVHVSNISWPSAEPAHDGTVIASASADTSWDAFVTWCCSQNLQGIECMAGIPGTVGGAVFGAIGAYGQQVADCLAWVDELNLRTGIRRRRHRDRIVFAYRYSDYHASADIVILDAGFRLAVGGRPQRTHPDIAQASAESSSLVDIATAVRAVRTSKGAMLWLPHRGHNLTAGSFFKNPTLSAPAFDRLRSQLDTDTPRRWWWPTEDGYRVSAAHLIESAGFTKGYREGDAAISPEHTLSLVNLGDARAADILSLARRIRDGVHQRFYTVLRPEVRFIGFRRPPLD